MKPGALIIIVIAFLVSSLFSQQIQFLTPNQIDLGKIKEGEDINGSIKFINVGKSAVTIKNIRTSCGCTAAKPDKNTYASGDTAEVDYTIKTKGFKGTIHKSIRIFFEGADIKDESFTISAFISREINITPNYLQFNQVSQNSDTVITEFFEIQNEAEIPFEIKKIAAYNDSLLKIFPDNTTIPPHKSHLFQVRLTPRKAGRFDTRISIESTYQKEPVMYLPVFIQIKS